MKKLLLAVSLLSGLTFGNTITAKACDKSCTMGGHYIGVLPQIQKNFIGVRFNTRQYTFTQTHTHVHEGMVHEHQEVTKESYNTYEVWGRFYPAKRIQAFVFVPYIFNIQTQNTAALSQQGLGDITLLANYAVLNYSSFNSSNLKQTLLIGGGVKLPTGVYKAHNTAEIVAPSLLPGTGSVDYLVNGSYTLRYKKVGVNTDFTYRINSESRNGYQFGNRYNGSANIFYWYEAGKLAILPSTGLYFEKANPDSFNDDTHTQMGGEGLFANVGLSFYYKSVALGGTIQKSMGQHHQATHVTENNSRPSLYFSVMF
ncbi:hypothetical protein [Adhaeribacter rhizoryzae]|uniref:Transporter n=1 Tax=Adhaeribacter rhizoryzae TaxID=2607907 RepID=A0A5M6D479_9BACT|nr:hypothetical protein [Adhaeribacter rhizoryzae]KAA5539985.1 hypothetical protein F0145_23645 [Adhaeribacter rhizoryzae]